MNGHGHGHQNHNNHHQFHEKTTQQFRQLHLDYDMSNNKENNISHHHEHQEEEFGGKIQNNRAEPQQQAASAATRIPSGHMRRDRASLRLKHRKEMEQAKLQVKIIS